MKSLHEVSQIKRRGRVINLADHGPVALLVALGWIGASLGFSRVVPVLWGTTQLYGTLGSVVLFLIWAYLNSWILRLGGFLLVRRPRDR